MTWCLQRTVQYAISKWNGSMMSQSITIRTTFTNTFTIRVGRRRDCRSLVAVNGFVKSIGEVRWETNFFPA